MNVNYRKSSLLEVGGREEVQQMKQLLQIILQRRPRQQQLVTNVVALQNPEELKIE